VIAEATTGIDVTIDWEKARKAFEQMTSVPVAIGVRNFTRASAPTDTATTSGAR